jgi:hypothetical protein
LLHLTFRVWVPSHDQAVQSSRLEEFLIELA